MSRRAARHAARAGGASMRGAIAVLLVLSLARPLGCASTPTAADPKSPDPTSAPAPQTKSDPAPAPGGTSPTGRERVDSAVESMIVGAMIGAIFGPIGAAARRGRTRRVRRGHRRRAALRRSEPGGRTRLRGGSRGRDGARDRDRDREAGRARGRDRGGAEAAGGAAEADRPRREGCAQAEQAAATGDRDERRASVGSAPTRRSRRRSATCPPRSSRRSRARSRRASGATTSEIEVVARSLDADRDGAPEEVRYLDPKTGVIVRKEEDRDYDGRIDAWTRYEAAARRRDRARHRRRRQGRRVAELRRATAAWPRARSIATPTARATPSTSTQGDSLVEERHDGELGREARSRRLLPGAQARAAAEEDLDHDGAHRHLDATSQTPATREVVARRARHRAATARPTPSRPTSRSPASRCLEAARRGQERRRHDRRESVYENGKLKQRQISDPDLMPL